MKNRDNDYDSRICPVTRTPPQEAQNDQMVRSIHLATRSSAFMHGAVWSFFRREFGSLFWIFICLYQKIYFKKSVGKGENTCFSWDDVLLFSIICLMLDHPWSLQSQCRRTKPSTKKPTKLHVHVLYLVFAGLKCLINFLFSLPTFKVG